MLSQADVREAFHYDPDTGDLIWRVRSREHYKTAAAWKRCNTRFAGKPFGRIGRATRSVSYRQGLFMGKRRMAHRLIFLYIYGYLPEQIDHIDGDGLNNRIENLRDATRSENARNRVCPINNAAADALMAECGIDKATAQAVIVAIAKGTVPAVTIRY